MSEHIRGNTINSKNREIEFGKDTGERCPSCGVQSKQNLCVRSDIDGSATLECPNCEYVENRPSARK